MSSNPLRLQILFRKYANNTCTKQELEEFWILMKEYSDNDLVSVDLEALLNDDLVYADTAMDNEKSEEIYSRLQQKITNQETDYTKFNVLKRNRIIRYAVAASLLFGLFFSSLWFFSKNDLDSAPPIASKVSAPLQTIKLPDGTIVTLNKNSKLDYPASFNMATRDVYLTGQAYFDVKHDAKRPFLVHTGGYITKVLGTAFDIKAYPGENDVTVSVSRGKVQVLQAGLNKPLGILIPGLQLIADKTTHKSTIKKSDITKVLAWKLPDLKFENIALDEAALRMSNYYGVEVRFKTEALRNCLFTADFTNYTIDQALDIICTLTNSKWNREGDIVWLDGNGCQH